MPKLHKRSLLLLFYVFFQVSALQATIPYGFWKAEIKLIRKPSMPLNINLNIRESAAGIEVLLDIPDLMMAWEPVASERKGDSLFITLPFGIGKFNLIKTKDSINAHNNTCSLRGKLDQQPVYAKKDIVWQNDTVTLRGSIYYPDEKLKNKKSPLVVIAHGAATSSRKRWEYRSWANIFLEKGFAVLLYDRRGSGESSGNLSASTLTDLGDDLLAGIKSCYDDPKIDTSNIGIAGGSQAGYIGFMLAAKEAKIKFMFLTSASAVGVDQQEIHNVLYFMKKEKETPQNIDTAHAYMRLYFYYVSTGKGWDELSRMARKAETSKWGNYVDQPLKENDLAWWRKNYNQFRPELVLPKINIPVLLLYGSTDFIVPPIENIGIMQHYLNEAGNLKSEIYELKGVGHNLEMSPFTDKQGYFNWPQKHPDFFTRFNSWIRKIIHE